MRAVSASLTELFRGLHSILFLTNDEITLRHVSLLTYEAL